MKLILPKPVLIEETQPNFLQRIGPFAVFPFFITGFFIRRKHGNSLLEDLHLEFLLIPFCITMLASICVGLYSFFSKRYKEIGRITVDDIQLHIFIDNKLQQTINRNEIVDSVCTPLAHLENAITTPSLIEWKFSAGGKNHIFHLMFDNKLRKQDFVTMFCEVENSNTA
jgi:hypothetical protein